MSADPDAEDVKPKLNLIINYEGQHITVKVKTHMPFRKIFEAAEKRFGKDTGTFRFIYDGNRLRPDGTPAEVNMEDGDMIDAVLQQVGGGVPIPTMFLFSRPSLHSLR